MSAQPPTVTSPAPPSLVSAAEVVKKTGRIGPPAAAKPSVVKSVVAPRVALPVTVPVPVTVEKKVTVDDGSDSSETTSEDPNAKPEVRVTVEPAPEPKKKKQKATAAAASSSAAAAGAGASSSSGKVNASGKKAGGARASVGAEGFYDRIWTIATKLHQLTSTVQSHVSEVKIVMAAMYNTNKNKDKPKMEVYPSGNLGSVTPSFMADVRAVFELGARESVAETDLDFGEHGVNDNAILLETLLRQDHLASGSRERFYFSGHCKHCDSANHNSMTCPQAGAQTPTRKRKRERSQVLDELEMPPVATPSKLNLSEVHNAVATILDRRGVHLKSMVFPFKAVKPISFAVIPPSLKDPATKMMVKKIFVDRDRQLGVLHCSDEAWIMLFRASLGLVIEANLVIVVRPDSDYQARIDALSAAQDVYPLLLFVAPIAWYNEHLEAIEVSVRAKLHRTKRFGGCSVIAIGTDRTLGDMALMPLFRGALDLSYIP